MCGRYSNAAEFSEIRLGFRIEQTNLFKDWTPTYNIAPSRGPGFEQLIVVPANSERALRLARWWLIPSFWRRPLKDLPTAFNARAEDLERRSLWRSAFQSQRCVVPATGWREFQGPRGKKQPFHFTLPEPLFGFAGLWSTWRSPEGESVDSFAIITTTANAVAARVHDRMPLVLPANSYDAWLDPATAPRRVLDEVTSQASTLRLEVYAADPIGNSVHYEGERVLAHKKDI